MTKMQTKTELVLRKTPSASTKILDIIPMGESVSVIETLDTWSKVDYNDQEGWVPSSQLTSGSVSKIAPKLETKDIEVETEEILEDVKEKYGVDISTDEDDSKPTLEEDKNDSEKSVISEVSIGESTEKKTRKNKQ
jgi:uncharacterized protein YgiM (DUF1202 family)